MPLPLSDVTNPLYNLTVDDQCRVLAQWRKTSLTAYQILSLPQSYTQNQITKAYRQLAARFHPDKNLGNDSAAEAFQIIAAACEYMEYGLLPDLERKKALNRIRNNSFFQAYGDEGLGLSNSTFSYFGGFQDAGFSASSVNPTKQEKSYEGRNFSELLTKLYRIPSYDVFPVRLVQALKRHIETNKSHLTTKENVSGQVISHIVARHGDFVFLKWLIEAGADPRIRIHEYHSKDKWEDVAVVVASKGNVDFLRYLLQRFGAAIFYDETELGQFNAQWHRFDCVLESRNLEPALFLLNEVGYAKHADSQPSKSLRYWIEIIRSRISHVRYYGSEPSVEEKLRPLNILHLLLTRKEIPLDDVHFAIDELTESLNSIDDYAVKQRAFDVVCQLLDHLIAQSSENASRPKVRLKAPRMLTLFYRAVEYTNYETLERLQTLSKIPPDIAEKQSKFIDAGSLERSYSRNNLLWEAFWHWRTPDYWRGYPDSENRQGSEKRTLRTLSFLIDLDQPGLLEGWQTFDDLNGSKYKEYTLLHLACEAGWQDWALQLIKKMKERELFFDAIATRQIDGYRGHRGNATNRGIRHYSPLHLAIEKGLTSVAVSLIEAGADTHLKAVIHKPSSSTCCFVFFGQMQLLEQTPLEMAIELKQPQVIRALQRVMIDEYIRQREAEPEYLSQLSVFGYILLTLGCFNLFGLILGFGHSKTAKLETAYEFRDLLNANELDETAFNRFNNEIAQEGRLGQIVQLSQHYLVSEPALQRNPARI